MKTLISEELPKASERINELLLKIIYIQQEAIPGLINYISIIQNPNRLINNLNKIIEQYKKEKKSNTQLKKIIKYLEILHINFS